MNQIFALDTEPDRFRERVWPFLAADAVVRTLPMTILDAAVNGIYSAAVLASVEDANGAVTGCALQTPPYNLIVAADSADDVRALAHGLQGRPDVALPGVVGMRPWGEEFAAVWCEGQGCVASEDRASRLFRLDTLVPPRQTTGSARAATADDLDLVVSWMEAFALEVGGAPAHNARRNTEARIDGGRLMVWQTVDAVVSFLGHSPVLADHARIGPVYTPPEHRGAGYASNLVAYASQVLLDLGAVPTLFTDVANPTSNAIYQAIGYTPVADASEITFSPAPAG
jgi:GNAT superfamily N-acetyltransferase